MVEYGQLVWRRMNHERHALLGHRAKERTASEVAAENQVTCRNLLDATQLGIL